MYFHQPPSEFEKNGWMATWHGMDEGNRQLFLQPWPLGSPFPEVRSQPAASLLAEIPHATTEPSTVRGGEPEVNEEMGEGPSVWHENDPSWGDEAVQETTDLPASLPAKEPTPTQAPPTHAANQQPLGALGFNLSYLCDLIPEINVEDQLLVWTISQNNTALFQAVSSAQEQVIGLSKRVNNLATAILGLSRSFAALQTRPTLPPALPTNKGMQPEQHPHPLQPRQQTRQRIVHWRGEGGPRHTPTSGERVYQGESPDQRNDSPPSLPPHTPRPTARGSSKPRADG